MKGIPTGDDMLAVSVSLALNVTVVVVVVFHNANVVVEHPN